MPLSHLLSLGFIEFLNIDKKNGINVISECLKTAISTDIKKINIDGIAAISFQMEYCKLSNKVNQIPQPIIITANCLSHNHRNIGSSFSI